MRFCLLYVEGIVGKLVYVSDELWTVMLHKLFVIKASYCSWFVEIGVVVLGLEFAVALVVVLGPYYNPVPMLSTYQLPHRRILYQLHLYTHCSLQYTSLCHESQADN
jgi:hypothetical protein